MSGLFLKIMNMSIAATWLILAVVLTRALLKKAPKWITCLLWALVAFRLICPISFESVLSVVPSRETIPADIAVRPDPGIDSGIAVVNRAVNPVISQSLAPAAEIGANPMRGIVSAASIVWAVGAAIMLVYALISYLRLKGTLGASVPLEKGLAACDEVKSPFILGLFKPMIYVPSSMSGQTLENVLRHERAHIKRLDHWWKPLGFLLLSIYWFNPLCWAAYILLCRDIELACDEKVIRDMDGSDIASYSQALLDCSLPRKRIAACPLAFGEVGVKERVKGVLSYKKPAFWIIMISVAACAVLAACLMTDPKSSFALKRADIEKVTYYNAFTDGDPLMGELNAEQTDELAERFSAVREARRSDVYAGQTPGYKLTVQMKNGSFVYANGYNASLDMAEIVMNGKSYAVSDAEFASYLRKVCSGAMLHAISYELGETAEYFTGTPTEAGAGDTVEIRTAVLYDADIHVYADGVEIEKTHYDSDYWGYSFVMPDKEVKVSARFFGKEEMGSGETEHIASLRKLYPEYFDLPASDGLEVYVWQLAAGSYSFGLLPGTIRERTFAELLNLKGVTKKEMRAILSTYDIDESSITIYPWQNPISSYVGEYWIRMPYETEAMAERRRQQFVEKIRQMLFGEPKIWSRELPNQGMQVKTAVAFTTCVTEYDKVSDCLNADRLSLSANWHLPVYKLDTQEELTEFMINHWHIFDLHSEYDGLPSFRAVTEEYDDAFFAEHSVILAYVSSSQSSSYRYALQGVSTQGSALTLNIARTNDPEVFDEMAAGWFVFAEVLKTEIAEYTIFDALMNN